MKITKKTAEMYSFRNGDECMWADIILQYGKNSVHFICDSDYGTFSYYWGSTGDNPKEFLTRIDRSYVLRKIFGSELSEPAPEKYDDEVKQIIIEQRRNACDYSDPLTKEEAREAWNDMIGSFEYSRDIYYEDLLSHHLFSKVFGDYDMLPSATKLNYRADPFFNDIWTPMVNTLKEELEEEKAHVLSE